MLRTLWTARWLGITAAALLVIVAFGALSAWQWERAQRDQEQQASVPAANVLVGGKLLADSAYGARVESTGVYDADRQVLVALGPDAFWVVTPLRPESGPAIPVARGTVASGDAVPAAPTGKVRVVGIAQPYEGDPGTSSTLPAGQVDRLTASAFAPEDSVTGGWIALESQDPSVVGLSPVVAPIAAAGASSIRLQNATYAVQWVLFAAFVVFFWVRMLRYDVGGVTTAPPADQSAPVREVY